MKKLRDRIEERREKSLRLAGSVPSVEWHVRQEMKLLAEMVRETYPESYWKGMLLKMLRRARR